MIYILVLKQLTAIFIYDKPISYLLNEINHVV